MYSVPGYQLLSLIDLYLQSLRPCLKTAGNSTEPWVVLHVPLTRLQQPQVYVMEMQTAQRAIKVAGGHKYVKGKNI